MRNIIIAGTMILSLIVLGCEEENGGNEPSGNSNNPPGNSDNPPENSDNLEWLVPLGQIFDGGPGKDGIPALDQPIFISPSQADYINDNDLVIGFKVGNEVKAYPHSILDWHEIINDRVGDISVAVTYCPLTGTAIGWNREINGEVTTFGVSGLLYNSNLIPYDRETDSNWSQMRLDCINGPLIEAEIEVFTLFETTWKTWKEMYPSTLVVSDFTGYSRSYGQYPYGNYRTNDSYIIFPVNNRDGRLPNKDRVHGIIRNNDSRIYPLSLFGNNVAVIQDTFKLEDYVIVGNSSDNFAVAFFSRIGDKILSFSPLQDDYPIIMSDEEGNMWDVFGKAVSGPREGSQLVPARSFTGYWFSFAAFYPSLTIYGE